MSKADQFEIATLDDEIWKLTPFAKDRVDAHRSRINFLETFEQIVRSLLEDLKIALPGRANSLLYPLEEESLDNHPSHYYVHSLELQKLHRLEISHSKMIHELPKQLTDLRKLTDLHYKWGTPKLDYFLEKLSHQNIVKLLGYCCKDELLMQKKSLENQFLRKYPVTIEQSSWGRPYEIAQSLNFLHNSEKKHIHRDLKAFNILLIDGTSHNSTEKVNAMDADEFPALDVSSVLKPSGKTGIEIKKSRLGDEDEAVKAFKWWHQPSHLQKNWPNMKAENESQSNVYPLLLLIAKLLSTTTFLTALTIRGCRLEEGYKYDSSLNPVYQMVNQDPLITRFVIALNSVAFFSSLALMMILFNELPLRL